MTNEPMTLRVYGKALWLYPRAFRERYTTEQIAVAAAWHRDSVTTSRVSSCAFAMRLAGDFAVSLPREIIRQLWRYFMKRPVIVYSTVLFVLIAGIAVFSAVFDHAMLRRSANQPQQQMAARYAERLSTGAAPEAVLPGGHVDITRDLDPFVNIYDVQGVPLAGNGFLGATLPAPPAGVFAEARAHGINKVSWRPQPGTRVAAVVQPITGPHPGFVVAGRSLSDVERGESQIYGVALHGLLLLFVLITGAGIMLTRSVNRGPGPAAA